LRHPSPNQQPLDIIFLDPPFATDLLNKCLTLLATHQFVGENTLLYIETDKPILPEKLPAHWQLLKQKVAGEVAYHLVKGANS
ncbi:MAG TPA: RsmD family RNA methyltransferase, partial [Candidatus Berkiella sp.]|nr:RsmD family RNA methyltransferase [Candidatus Berkiella sp.]